MVFSPYVLNRNADVYPCPEKFLPDRWLEMKPNAFAYPTFNAGPRTCLGQAMAVLEIKMIIALMMQKFTISNDPSRKVSYNPDLTMPVHHGLFVHLAPRNQPDFA